MRFKLHISQVPLPQTAVEAYTRHLVLVGRVDERLLDLAGVGHIGGEERPTSSDIE